MPSGPGLSRLGQLVEPAGIRNLARIVQESWSTLRALQPDPFFSCLGPRARGVDQLSGATRVHVRRPAVSTSSPAGLGPMFKGRCGRAAVLGESGPGPRTSRVNQMSQATRAWARGPARLTSSPGHSQLVLRARGFNQLSQDTQAQVRGPAGSTRHPGGLGPGSEGLRGRPAVLGSLGPVPRARGVDHLSWGTQAIA